MFYWKLCHHRDVTELSAPLMTAGRKVTLQSGLLYKCEDSSPDLEAAVTPFGLSGVTWLRQWYTIWGKGWRRWLTGWGKKGKSCSNFEAVLTDVSSHLFYTHWHKPQNDYLIWQESHCGEQRDTEKYFNVSQGGLLQLALHCWSLWVTSCRAAAFYGVKNLKPIQRHAPEAAQSITVN